MSDFIPPDVLLERTLKHAQEAKHGFAFTLGPQADVRGYLAFSMVHIEQDVAIVQRSTIAEIRALIAHAFQEMPDIVDYANRMLDRIQADLDSRCR